MRKEKIQEWLITSRYVGGLGLCHLYKVFYKGSLFYEVDSELGISEIMTFEEAKAWLTRNYADADILEQ